MINQVIKTKAQAKKVANAMKKDINTLLSIYESYSEGWKMTTTGSVCMLQAPALALSSPRLHWMML